VSTTIEVYAHVLPDMQKEASAKLGTLLRGRPLEAGVNVFWHMLASLV
jgi:hypothetical protein